MMGVVRIAAAAAFLLAPLPALAQDGGPVPPTRQSPTSVAPIDPARLTAARATVDFVFPSGTYARMMSGAMEQMMSGMMDNVGKMPLRGLAGVAGASETDLANMGSATLAQVMAITDPAYRQRMDITSRTMMREMTGLMSSFEPSVRDGLANAYARRFSVAQLDELNTFFATPTGRAYANDAMMIMTDPEVMGRIQALVPQMLQQMPAMMERVQQATASLPKARSFDELSTAEKAKLSRLLGQPRR